MQILGYRGIGSGLERLFELLALGFALVCIAGSMLHIPTVPTPSPVVGRPDLSLQRCAADGSYRVLSEDGCEDAQHISATLATLRQQFEQHFAAIIPPGATPAPAEVLYFRQSEPYRAYAARVAPAFVDSAGFFCAQHNRLVVLDQAAMPAFARVQHRLLSRQRRVMRDRRLAPTTRVEASARLAEMCSAVAGEAQAATERLLRHEGAHQLLHAYGLEPATLQEPTWLTEGLAQYCEPPEIGAPHPVLIARLIAARDNGSLLPWRELLEHRSPAGFFALPQAQIEPAYAQAWAMTYSLLNGDLRAPVLRLLKHLAEGESDAELTAEGLAELLTTELADLELTWDKFIQSL